MTGPVVACTVWAAFDSHARFDDKARSYPDDVMRIIETAVHGVAGGPSPT
jgi:hypothetical protein